MNLLFEIDKIKFYEEDFQDDITEYEDIIPIVQDIQESLKVEEIQCTDENDCCNKTKMNYFVEIQGFITPEDEFVLQSEMEQFKHMFEGQMLDLFVIRIYKCMECNKWIFDILE
ncbi:hypothetical protein SAMN02745163_00811 [Clostridium cavendishii DSM 21758]|uniref:Uncharacterized protein n=1 Tax=Clostridium cavendishii DSM 21758 TaxID=1121302 RepID=A0A1M6EBG4_9CLOT|nr:hypothetical protein [Clostridium cavendishii]SHI82791.1 hypothetical protein SAMN02745163_00811 [Clostridium cavendishii DSM 21758]